VLPSAEFAEHRPAAVDADVGHMEVEPTTVHTLNLLHGDDGNDGGGLLSFLDATRTPAGRRRLRQWILRPLRQMAGINRRLDAVEALVSHRCVGRR
jgi:DNA mismatch repair ATPase MutS